MINTNWYMVNIFGANSIIKTKIAAVFVRAAGFEEHWDVDCDSGIQPTITELGEKFLRCARVISAINNDDSQSTRIVMEAFWSVLTEEELKVAGRHIARASKGLTSVIGWTFP